MGAIVSKPGRGRHGTIGAPSPGGSGVRTARETLEGGAGGERVPGRSLMPKPFRGQISGSSSTGMLIRWSKDVCDSDLRFRASFDLEG